MVRRKTRDASDALLPGYGELQEIGGGAFATVFKAVEVETGRPVALKILKVDTIHAHLIETFHHEIQALAAVSDHPNIVTLYRPSNTVDGRPVLVLELCRGSLGQQLRTNGPIDPVEVTRIGIKIAGALETAHRNGFLHRDMKPQNILITQFAEPALADFGVAALQASAQLTAGVFGFTTLHAAPEMLEGHHLSPATDIYGLASTMYQLLTGQAPFASYDNEAPASVILRILRDPVPPLRAEHIPLDLADLLEAALSKEPEGRPRSALEFAYALQRVESVQGWAETTFVAWGQEGRQPAPMIPARGPMGVSTEVEAPRDWRPGSSAVTSGPYTSYGAAGAAGAAGLGGAAGGGSATPASRYQPPLVSSPGIVTPSVERRQSLSDPGVTPDGQAGPRSPGHGGSLPPLLPPVGPAKDPDPSARGPVADTASPPATPVRPSLASPDAGRREVAEAPDAVQGRGAKADRDGDRPLAPGSLSRGWASPAPAPHPGPASPFGQAIPDRAPTHIPPPPPPPRPPPPSVADQGAAPASASRPVFCDPDPAEPAAATPVHDERLGVHRAFDGPPRPASRAFDPPATVAGRIVALPLWAVGALVMAGLVVIAAVLLIAGVI